MIRVVQELAKVLAEHILRFVKRVNNCLCQYLNILWNLCIICILLLLTHYLIFCYLTFSFWYDVCHVDSSLKSIWTRSDGYGRQLLLWLAKSTKIDLVSFCLAFYTSQDMHPQVLLKLAVWTMWSNGVFGTRMAEVSWIISLIFHYVSFFTLL